MSTGLYHDWWECSGATWGAAPKIAPSCLSKWSPILCQRRMEIKCQSIHVRVSQAGKEKRGMTSENWQIRVKSSLSKLQDLDSLKQSFWKHCISSIHVCYSNSLKRRQVLRESMDWRLLSPCWEPFLWRRDKFTFQDMTAETGLSWCPDELIMYMHVKQNILITAQLTVLNRVCKRKKQVILSLVLKYTLVSFLKNARKEVKLHALMHKQGRKDGPCMQQFLQEEATEHHPKCLWHAGIGKISPS